MKAYILLDSYKEENFIPVAFLFGENTEQILAQLKAEPGDYQDELVIMDQPTILKLMSDFVTNRKRFLTLTEYRDWSWLPEEHFFCLKKTEYIEYVFRSRCFWTEELPYVEEDQAQFSLIPRPAPKSEFRGLQLKIREIPFFTPE